MVEDGLLVDALATNEVEVELLLFSASVKHNHGSILLDGDTLLVIWVFNLSVVEWPHSDDDLDLVARVIIEPIVIVEGDRLGALLSVTLQLLETWLTRRLNGAQVLLLVH